MISGGYLEQIIDKMAVFEVVYGTKDEEETINAAIVDITNMPDELLEDYYYKFKIVSRNYKTYPFLPREDNKDIYKSYYEKYGYVEWLCLENFEIDIVKTHRALEEIRAHGRNLRLMNNFLDGLYKSIDKAEGDTESISVWNGEFDEEDGLAINKYYERYLKNKEKHNETGLSKEKWTEEYKNLIKELLDKEDIEDNYTNDLAGLNVTVHSLAHFLNKKDSHKYMVYKKDVYMLLKYMNYLKGSCETGSLDNKLKGYFKYNILLKKEIRNLCDDDKWEKDLAKQLAIARYISEFNISRFLWDNCKFPV